MTLALMENNRKTITPGRWRGLKSTATDEGIFTILAFDQRNNYRKMLPAEQDFMGAAAIKREIVVPLSQVTSAVLLDNQYGLEAALHMRGGCGLIMSVEESGYSGNSTYRTLMFDPDWTVEKIKRMGASAAKLLVYYHPDSGGLATEIETAITSVIEECHRYDLPLFLEPLSYSLDASIAKESAEFAQQRPRIVRETAARLSRLGADVLKLEFPVDAAFDGDRALWRASCEAISAECVTPWVLLSGGVDFEVYAEQVEIACAAGASGWLAGRAIWKEAVTMTAEHRAQFLQEEGVARIERLTRIAAQHSRPWTDFYAPTPALENWFRGT